MTKPAARHRETFPVAALDHVKHLFSTARPNDYREAILEIYHNYIIERHNTLPVDFGDIAHRVHVLVEFFKSLEEYDFDKAEKEPD